MIYGMDSVKEIIELSEGTRVEIDFIDVLKSNEGVLVGDTAKGFLHVLAETRQTETYPARPFRVNAGAIHQYIYAGDNQTKYLSELKAGDRIPVYDGENERYVDIGRIKIEKREFNKIILESGISATLQKADSVFVAGGDEAVHFLDISDGTQINCMAFEQYARHKGMVIEEEIVEK